MHRHPASLRSRSCARWLLLALFAGGCSEPEGFQRTVRPLGGQDVEFDLSTRDRLIGRSAPGLPSAATPGARLQFETPAGWQELPPTQFRNANFSVPGDPPAECYLSLLPGEAGGLALNVNRWVATQMGQPALDDAALAALPTRTFFGGRASQIDVTGTFAGMGAGPLPDYRMVGLLLCEPAGSRFLKLVGPSATVEAALPAFLDLADSMRFSPAQEPVGGSPSASVATAGEAAALGFTAPSDWERAGNRPMREVNFEIAHPAGGAPTEAYVSILGGDGGGVRENFDRWRNQMEQPALSTAEFEGLELLPMLGATGTLIQIEGPFRGMAGETIDEALLIGAIAPLGDRAVFVKLIGPADVASGQLDNFRAFCRSLQL